MWYYVLNDKHQPPVDVATLERLFREKVITLRTLVWRPGMADWLPLEDSELAFAEEGTPPPLSTRADASAPAVIDDGKETCAYSGQRAPADEMVRIEGFWILATEKDAAVEYLQQGGRLPKVRLQAAFAGNLDMGHLMNLSWQTLKGCLKPAVLLHLAIYLPLNTVTMYLLYPVTTARPPHPSQIMAIMVPSILVMLLLTPLVTGGVFFAFDRRLRGETVSVGETFAAAFANWGRVVAAQMATGLLCFFGFLLLIIPGFFFGVRSILATAAAVDQRVDGITAMSASWNLTKGHFWRTFLTLMGLAIACDMPAGMIMAAARAVLPGAGWVVPLEIVETVLRLPSLYVMAWLFCYYKELQATRARAAM